MEKYLYTIGEVEELTGVKSHILRYWETVIHGFLLHKDIGGRRIYTQRELEIVMRLKFLIKEKKFTIEGAREQIISEVDLIAENATLLKQIHDLRKDLTDLYMCVKNMKENQNKQNSAWYQKFDKSSKPSKEKKDKAKERFVSTAKGTTVIGKLSKKELEKFPI